MPTVNEPKNGDRVDSIYFIVNFFWGIGINGSLINEIKKSCNFLSYEQIEKFQLKEKKTDGKSLYLSKVMKCLSLTNNCNP